MIVNCGLVFGYVALDSEEIYFWNKGFLLIYFLREGGEDLRCELCFWGGLD